MRKNIKQLNLNPLSVAKFFYKKGIEIFPINQQLIYFTCLEAMKENYLLFEEEWQAWPNGPALKSVIDKMYDNRDNLKSFFKPIEDVNNELVINWAEKTFKKYKNTEQYLLFEKAQNKPWKDARKPLKEEKEIGKIPLTSLLNYTHKNNSRQLKSV
ncbi:MAG: SocA family protein [Spiroplasmataceae bacterium]|nr:SocA family protein [Spiroplasmataceae bacterium]